MDYTFEELFPVLQKLTEKYTLNESTSIRYELADQLMEAILYCIECTSTEPSVDALCSSIKVEATDAYTAGRKLVHQKTVAARELYEEILTDFDAYGNQTYYDTVIHGFPAFFMYYDIDFAPQDHLLTLDYPTLWKMDGLNGVHAAWEYLKAIKEEQKFLKPFPQQHINDVLAADYPDYQRLVINLCSPILRHSLSCMLINKPFGAAAFSTGEHAQLARAGKSKELKQQLLELLRIFVERIYGKDPALLFYLQADIADFSVRLAYFAELYPQCSAFHF